MTIFDSVSLHLFASERAPAADDAAARWNLLRRLVQRHTSDLNSMIETRVEQSFNELLFAQVFGYKTLYRDGAGEYHLDPKQRHPGGRYDDFGLGFFGPDAKHVRVSCELKGPRTDLDAPQKGPSYRGLSAVQQAFGAIATNPSIRWILVSNFDEVRIYRATDPLRYERIVLSEILSLSDFRRAWALLSRASVLGDVRDDDSPLDALANRGGVMLVPKTQGKVRIVHQAKAASGAGSELSLHAMDDALRKALKEKADTLLHLPKNTSPELVDDRLVIDARTSHGITVELTRSGVLRVSQYSDEGQTTGGRTVVPADVLALQIAHFIVFAYAILASLYGPQSEAEYTWVLMDVGNALCGGSQGWNGLATLSAPPTVEETRVPAHRMGVKTAVSSLVQSTMAPLRELLFPFVGLSALTGTAERLNPSPQSLESLLRNVPELDDALDMAPCFLLSRAVIADIRSA